MLPSRAMNTRSRAALATFAAALSLSVTASAQQNGARPAVDASIPAGERIVARWELPADRTNTPIVMLETLRAEAGVADEYKCVVAAWVNNAWQLNSAPSALDGNPSDCFSAARVDNQWVFGRWTLGGSGDGRNAVNESDVTLFAFVNNRFTQVGTSAVSHFGMLFGGEALALSGLSLIHI